MEPIPDVIPLDKQFINFSKFFHDESDGTKIKLSQIDRWLKQSGLIGKSLTLTDTGLAFSKFK